jgi:signal transduction histidine kinase
MDLKNIFTSGWNFYETEEDLVSKYQMMNVAIIFSSIGFLLGVVVNHFNGMYKLELFELLLFGVNIVLFFMLRRSKKYYDSVATAVTAQSSLLLISLIYVSDPSQMKHTWLFAFPIVFLYLKSDKQALGWFGFLLSMILVAPLQPFVEVHYSFTQVAYVSFVLVVVSIIVYFYREKMAEAKELIASQQKMLTQQSKQAVMGEMISMIAHQWRQPLSTVTLSISNVQVKKMLGEKIEEQEIDEVLETVSDTVVYLSETIDDFQTYFKPNKELQTIQVGELMEKLLHFISPRIKQTNIELRQKIETDITIQTYTSELIQVLLNIVNNSVDELIEHHNGCGFIELRVAKKEGKLFISIEDNAGGIKRENIEMIFEPYVSTKGKNGTGLGLYMSQMIMQKQFNSKIKVHNSKHGAVFELMIPTKLS